MGARYGVRGTRNEGDEISSVFWDKHACGAVAMMLLMGRYGVRGAGCEGEENKMEFSDLRVWQEAKKLALEIYQLTGRFPKSETYSLADQLRRSSVSICANIAEGFNRYHAKDKIRFYYNARGSISESQSHLLIAMELGYIDKPMTVNLVDNFDSVRKMLNAMVNSINRHNDEQSQT